MAFTAIIEKEGNLYVAKAAELEIASQGKSIEHAIANLKEAIELYLKHAEPDELAAIKKRQASLLFAPIEVGGMKPKSASDLPKTEASRA